MKKREEPMTKVEETDVLELTHLLEERTRMIEQDLNTRLIKQQINRCQTFVYISSR